MSQTPNKNIDQDEDDEQVEGEVEIVDKNANDSDCW